MLASPLQPTASGSYSWRQREGANGTEDVLVHRIPFGLLLSQKTRSVRCTKGNHSDRKEARLSDLSPHQNGRLQKNPICARQPVVAAAPYAK